MAKSAQYRVLFRRHRTGKTNYYLRKKLLASRGPRLVVRKTLNYIITQICDAKVKGDKTLISAFSGELKKEYGWLAGVGNLSAAYLTAYLLALRATKKRIKHAVLDIGLIPPTKGSRVFAALKGALDAGLDVPHSEEVLPSEDRIRGKHIAEYAKKLASEDSRLFNKQFSRIIKRGLDPRDFPEHFDKIKKNMIDSFGGK
ncbi:MAG: 50S ribosomal protein L18 [Promethearchaeota archaeon]